MSGRRRVPATPGDAIVAVGLFAYSSAEIVLGGASQATPVQLAITATMTLPLAVRRLRPVVPALAFSTGLVVGSLAIPPVPLFGEFVAGLLTAYSLAVHATRRGFVLAGAGLAAAVSVFVARDPSGGFLPFGLETILPFAASTGIGLFVRRRRREAGRAAQQAAADERARLARELHDLVGHAVSLMTVQAGVGRVALDAGDSQRARTALNTVETTGREALDELRRLLGIVRVTEGDPAALAPQPGLDAIASLVESLRDAGQTAHLRIEGTPTPIPAGVALTAYRIVQEALTNVRKHAGGAGADVIVRYGDRLEIEVSDRGPGGVPPARHGHGLQGMRERAALYGGDLHAGPAPEGGFVVRTTLPVSGGTG